MSHVRVFEGQRGTGENGNVREAGCEVKEGRREVSKSNEKSCRKGTREKERGSGLQLPAVQRGRAMVFIRFRVDGDKCTLRTSVSKKGGKEREKLVKSKFSRQQTARRRKQRVQ